MEDNNQVHREDAITFYRQALELRPAPHPDRSESLSNLAASLSTRFERTSDLGDLKEAITLYRQALELRPTSHPNRSVSLDNLAISLGTRFGQMGVGDLEEAIILHRQALELRPTPHPDRPTSLNNLAHALITRFEQKGSLGDLEEAITFDRQALKLMPTSHPKRSVLLSNLANSLRMWFEQKGDPSILEEAIEFHKQALELKPTSNSNRSGLLSNFAVSLVTRFTQNGDLGDLEEAITFHRQALEVGLPLHPDQSTLLNNLAISLMMRFRQKSDLDDLEEAMTFHRQALKLRPASYPERSASLNNLGNCLFMRFGHKSNQGDLDEAIAFHREALELRPAPHPERSASLSNLAVSLSTRFEQKGDLADLDEAIIFDRQGLELRPLSHPDRSMSLNSLGNTLWRRFEHTDDLRDLEEAITFHRQALKLRPTPHPDRSGSLRNLASVLYMRLAKTCDAADLEEAISLLREGAVQEMGPVTMRFSIANRWAYLAEFYAHQSALEAYECVIGLLPRLASLDRNIQQRQQALSQSKGLPGRAARYAIQRGKLELAVEFLTSGRSVFWTQALNLRTPMDALAAKNSQLAKRLRDISGILETASAIPLDRSSMSLSQRANADIDLGRYRRLTEDWDRALEEARQIEGFEDFLRPVPFSKLKGAASKGPVAILTSSLGRADALILTSHGVRHVPLDSPEVTLEHMNQLWKTRKFRGEVRGVDRCDDLEDAGALSATLEILWNAVVKKVIDELKLKKMPNGPTQRVWWCPTGPFSLLPIHAAGVYTKNGECISDYCISSYCSSLQDLLRSPDIISFPDSKFKMLAVIQPNVHGFPEIPGTRLEMDLIEKYIPHENLTKLDGKSGSPVTAEQVLAHLPHSSFVHFGCHGLQHPEKPLDSALILETEHLRIVDIVNVNILNAWLAYLSACETATGDKDSPDETLHIARSMLFAGFRGVVGTLWPIHDDDGPRVAEAFYSHLFRDGQCDPRNAAIALHFAMRELRESGASLDRWMPFIHLGV